MGLASCAISAFAGAGALRLQRKANAEILRVILCSTDLMHGSANRTPISLVVCRRLAYVQGLYIVRGCRIVGGIFLQRAQKDIRSSSIFGKLLDVVRENT